MAAPVETRPSVTLVTSDLKGSTALGERLDPEALREVLNRYFSVMRLVFESHGGRIEKIIGDAIVAVFGLPEPAEDDALRAVEAAAESMRALATLNDELEAGWGVRLVTRTGVASGEVTFGEDLEGQHVLLGDTVEVSGVMEQNAPPLEVLIADSTRLICIEEVHGLAGCNNWGASKFLYAPETTGKDFTLVPDNPLSTLDKFRDAMTIVSNTDARNAEAFALPEIGGDHFRSSAVFLTQMHPKQTQQVSLTKWARTGQLRPEMDSDQACLQCHKAIGPNITEHTHHEAASSGSRCYNCHMPHNTFGLLHAMRGHQVSWPTVQERNPRCR